MPLPDLRELENAAEFDYFRRYPAPLTAPPAALMRGEDKRPSSPSRAIRYQMGVSSSNRGLAFGVPENRPHEYELPEKAFMLKTGYKYLVSTDVLAIEHRAGRSRTITVPSGSLVEVADIHCQHDARLTEVLWDERRLLLFGNDLIHLAHRIEYKFSASSAFASARAA